MGGGQQLPIHFLTAPPSFASSDSTDNTNLDLATAHLWVRDTIHSIAEHVKQLSTMKWDPAALQPSDIDDGDDVVVRDLAGLVGAVVCGFFLPSISICFSSMLHLWKKVLLFWKGSFVSGGREEILIWAKL